MEVAVLIGLSAIISSEWGARNIIFHLVGDSGTGKTTTAILAISTVGCPNPVETRRYNGADGKPLRSLMSSWKGTSNALIAKLDGLDGTLMVFDELSKVESTEILSSTIYTLSDGADKDRMDCMETKFMNCRFENLSSQENEVLDVWDTEFVKCKFSHVTLSNEAYLTDSNPESSVEDCQFEDCTTDREDEDLFRCEEEVGLFF